MSRSRSPQFGFEISLGAAAMLVATGLATVNCSRTPKFIDANKPAPVTNGNSPAASPANSVAIAAASGNPSAPAPTFQQSVMTQLTGTWLSTCASPSDYESESASIPFTENANIRVRYTFNADGTYERTITAFSDVNCMAATGQSVTENGKYGIGDSVANGALPGAVRIALTGEYNVIAIDGPNLSMGPAGSTDPSYLPGAYAKATYSRVSN